MVNTDYRIEALGILLSEDCLSERYYPLVERKEALICGLTALGCRVKSDITRVPDETLQSLGLADAGMVALFRKFLTIDDAKPAKLREIEKLAVTPAERAAFAQLYLLPGVKQTRADLYCRAGYRSLASIAQTTVTEVLARTAKVIADENLTYIVPLPKEVRTHIAVAKAFCG